MNLERSQDPAVTKKPSCQNLIYTVHPKHFPNTHLFSCQSSPSHSSLLCHSTEHTIRFSTSTSGTEEKHLLILGSWRLPPLSLTSRPIAGRVQDAPVALRLGPWANYSRFFSFSVCRPLSNSDHLNNKLPSEFCICRSVQCIRISFSLALFT